MSSDLTVKVEKRYLIEKLKYNRSRHALELQKAEAGFRKVHKKELKQKLKNVEEGGEIKLNFKNRPPDNNLKAYDEVIEMLQIAEDEAIELDSLQYRKYIKDKWEWRQFWAESVSAYI